MKGTAQVRALLAPLEDFDRLHATTLRRFGNRVVDLSYPNPRVHIDRRPYDVLTDLATGVGLDELRYSPFGGFTTTRRNVATALTRRHGLPYTFQDIILTPGATAAINLALQTMFTPQDRVMVMTPCWMDYPLYLANLGLGCDLVPADDRKHLDLAAIEHAWTPATRGVILSQPVSPTGVCYTGDELNALAAMLRRLGARSEQLPTLVSDETHRDQVWTGTALHSPVLSHPRSVSVYSFGKSWQMQGQRIGYVAVSPLHPQRETVRQRLVTGMRVTGYCAPTALMQHLAAALSDFTPQLGALSGLQRRTRSRLCRAGFDVIDADATHFVYVRVPMSDDVQFATLAARRGVLVMPSTVFHEPGYFRIALNVDVPTLDQGIDVLAETSTARTGNHA